MGLRCSLIGHDWGESEIERDRDEQGSEVVLTVREYEVCARCGERNLISENTEVTTLADGETSPERAPEPTRDGASEGDSTPSTASATDDEPVGEEPVDDESVADDASTVSPSTGSDVAAQPMGEDDAEILDDDAPAAGASSTADEPATADDEPVEEGGEDAVFIDDAEGEQDVATAADVIGDAEEPVTDAAPDAHAEPDAAVESDAGAEPDASGESAAADDGVIMDDEDGQDAAVEDRDHGEWPEHEDDVAPNAHAGGSSGAAAAEQAPPEDASVDAESDASAAATAVDGNEDDGYDAEFIDGEGQEADAGVSEDVPKESPSGIKSAGSTAPPGERHTRQGELVCPNCSNAESADRTSLRAGDICPECRKGYLSNPGE